MPSGCTTHCPPTIHWYSVFWRNESPIPPCQPAMPTPLHTAFSRPCSCSRVMLPIVQTGTTRLNDSIRSRSRYTSNVSQTSTWKPFDCRIGAKTSVHCLGSCPSQPPQTINALFISLYSSELLLVFDLCLAVQLASRQSHRQRRRLCAGAGDMHVFAALRCVLEGVHHIQDVVGQCAVRAVRPAAAQCIGHVRDPDAPAHLVAVGVRDLAPGGGARPPHLNRPAERVRIGHAQGTRRAVDLDVRQVREPDVEAGNDP